MHTFVIVQEIEAIKARVKEMEEEAEKLKEMQGEVEKQLMGSKPGESIKYLFKKLSIYTLFSVQLANSFPHQKKSRMLTCALCLLAMWATVVSLYQTFCF